MNHMKSSNLKALNKIVDEKLADHQEFIYFFFYHIDQLDFDIPNWDLYVESSYLTDVSTRAAFHVGYAQATRDHFEDLKYVGSLLKKGK